MILLSIILCKKQRGAMKRCEKIKRLKRLKGLKLKRLTTKSNAKLVIPVVRIVHTNFKLRLPSS